MDAIDTEQHIADVPDDSLEVVHAALARITGSAVRTGLLVDHDRLRKAIDARVCEMGTELGELTVPADEHSGRTIDRLHVLHGLLSHD